MYKKTVLSVIINIYYHIILSKYSIETSHRISHLLIRPLKEYDEDLSEVGVASCFYSVMMENISLALRYCISIRIYYVFVDSNALFFPLQVVNKCVK